MSEPSDPPAADMGPDPAYPLGVFVLGLFTMGVGGAFTWHWVFNVGELLLVLGGALFVVNMARTSLKQDPVEGGAMLNRVLRAVLRFFGRAAGG